MQLVGSVVVLNKIQPLNLRDTTVLNSIVGIVVVKNLISQNF